MKLLFTLVLFSSYFMHQLNASSGYTIRDLEALEAQKSYREFLQHALDIRPSERNSQWVSMVADMATGLIDFRIERLDFSRESFQEIEKYALWPTLQNDEFFQTKRANYLRRYLPDCLNKQQKTICEQDLTQYWNNSPKDIDLGIELAQTIVQNALSLPTWNFLAKASNSNLAHIFCQRAVVQEGLIHQLTSAGLTKLNLTQLREHLQSIMNQQCWDKLKPVVETELSMNTHSQLKREALYRLLKAQKAISSEDEDVFLITYLLQGPMVGETFNLAWGRVRELAQDYPRRKRVFDKISEMSLLPDNLFASANAQSRDVIMNHLYQFFPEYFPYYAKTCLNYRRGIGEFPLGNPTLHCADFFKISEDKKWVEQSVRIQYSGGKKEK